MKKVFALMLALVMMLVVTGAFAATITINSTAGDDVQTDTTVYTYYKILDADIENPTAVTVNTESGESTAATTGEDVPRVSYYVKTQAKATALEGTGLFTVTKDATADKWYVALKDDSTTGAEIATALNEIKDSFADASDTFAQTTPGGSATTEEELAPGYYLITSTLGDKLAVQTLADITINTKNDYPTVDKTIPETDKSAQIGDTITYTITVDVPDSANDQIIVTDTMTSGLTFKSITSVETGTDALAADTDYTFAKISDQSFTVTLNAATVTENKGKTISIIYTAVLNENAVVDAADDTDADATSNDNTVKINYGNHFESKPVTVETDTQKFTFDKIDGTDQKKLPGAIFELQLDGTALNLIEVAAGETYRIATAEEIANASITKVTQMTTNGNTITVNGVDGDVTYQLVEIQAPTGYNMPAEPSTDVKPETDNTLEIAIENNKGTVLPSTGGMGTTIFYVVGGLLIIGAAIVLVARRKAHE